MNAGSVACNNHHGTRRAASVSHHGLTGSIKTLVIKSTAALFGYVLQLSHGELANIPAGGGALHYRGSGFHLQYLQPNL